MHSLKALRGIGCARLLGKQQKLTAPHFGRLCCAALPTLERKKHSQGTAPSFNSSSTIPKLPPTQEDNQQSQTPAPQTGWDVKAELMKLGQLALPLLLQYIIANASTLINTSYVGHEADPVELSGLVLATSLSMATGYNIISGITSASATLCGQAFGSSNYSALHNTLQRSLLICALACVPITGVWMHAEWILQHLGQTPAIAAGASRYLQLTLPALYLYTIHECADKYLLSQGVVRPALAITAASTALTPVFAWWFVAHQGLGLEGAAWAYVAVQACTTGLGLAYLGYRELVKLPGTPPPGFQPLRPSRSALQGWGPYVALAVPAVLSYCMEGWAVEVLIFLSGLLDNAEVAVGVTGLALQFSTLVWLAAASLGSATSTRVAIELGRGDGLAAKRTAQTAVGAVLVTQTLIGLAAYSCARPLLGLMTNNTEVMQLSLTVMPVLACCFIADGLNAVQGAVLRGAGRQWWTAGLAIVGWWCVGVPLAYWLGLVQGGNVPGLWAGFAVASALQSGLQAVAINKFVDWDAEVLRAKAMMTDKPQNATIAHAVPSSTSSHPSLLPSASSSSSGTSEGAAPLKSSAEGWEPRSQQVELSDTPAFGRVLVGVTQDALFLNEQAGPTLSDALLGSPVDIPAQGHGADRHHVAPASGTESMGQQQLLLSPPDLSSSSSIGSSSSMGGSSSSSSGSSSSSRSNKGVKSNSGVNDGAEAVEQQAAGWSSLWAAPSRLLTTLRSSYARRMSDTRKRQ